MWTQKTVVLIVFLAVDFITDFLTGLATGLGGSVAGSAAGELVSIPALPPKYAWLVGVVGGLLTAFRGLKKNLQPSMLQPTAPLLPPAPVA